MPFWILYAVSNFLFFVLYRVIGYRKKVVENNLRNSFPEYSDLEIKKITKEFYKHLSDVFVESFKAFSISEKEAKKRYTSGNRELMDRLYAKSQHIILVIGHYNNWELLALCGPFSTQHKSMVFYTPLKNKFFNEKLKISRERFGNTLIPTSDPKLMFQECSERPSMLYFASDQSPRKSQKSYWTMFLNQETGVQPGAEKMAKKLNAAVVFGELKKVKRGHYHMTYHLLTENPKEEPSGFITKMHVQFLEKVIQNKPEHWLWSHKRWKHSRPENETLI